MRYPAAFHRYRLSGQTASAQRLLQYIHLRGFSYDNGEGGLEIRCVAVPVFDQDSHLIGAISIVGTINKFTTDKLSAIIEKAKKTALQITSGLMM